MNSFLRFALTTLTLVSICPTGNGQDALADPANLDALIQQPLPLAKRPPDVQLSAKTFPGKQSRIEIELKLGKGIWINSELESDIGWALKTELLDQQRKLIPAKFSYPAKSKFPTSIEPLSTVRYYTGSPKLVATIESESKPAFVKVSYQGFNEIGY